MRSRCAVASSPCYMMSKFTLRLWVLILSFKLGGLSPMVSCPKQGMHQNVIKISS